MSADTVSDLMRAIGLRGVVVYCVSNWDNWAAEAPPAEEIGAADMPRAEHVM